MKVIFISVIIQISFGIIIIHNLERQFNKNYYIPILTFENDPKTGELTVNFSSNFMTNLTAYVQFYTVRIATGLKASNYDVEVLKSSINVCKMANGTRGNFLIKMLMEEFTKHASFKIGCPLSTGLFNITNWKLNENLLPGFLLRNVSFMLRIDGKGKGFNDKGLKEMYSLKIFGKLIRK